MKIQKMLEDIKFTNQDVFGTEMLVSEPIVMEHLVGWYVGKICKEDGFATIR